MKDLMELVMLDVQAVSMRAVAGDGEQAELIIQTRRGALNLRLIGRDGRPIRLTDMRARDKKRRRLPLVTIPFADREV